MNCSERIHGSRDLCLTTKQVNSGLAEHAVATSSHAAPLRGMADRSSKPKRPRDPNVRAKLVADIATGQVEDATKEPKRQYSPQAHERGQMDKPEDKKTRQD